MGDGQSGGDDYTIRFFEPADRDGFLELYRSVMGPATEAWFRWKYEDNPYVAHVPVVVAVDDADGVVAARPQVPFRMQAGENRTLALRFGDTIVHEDHRRRGLFTRTTAFAMDYYSGQPPRFAFNFPNSLSEPGYRNVGGELVQELVTRYRVHDPGSVLEDRSVPGSDGLAAVGGRLACVTSTSRGTSSDTRNRRQSDSPTWPAGRPSDGSTRSETSRSTAGASPTRAGRTTRTSPSGTARRSPHWSREPREPNAGR
jgi:hypothetical protein